MPMYGYHSAETDLAIAIAIAIAFTITRRKRTLTVTSGATPAFSTYSDGLGKSQL